MNYARLPQRGPSPIYSILAVASGCGGLVDLGGNPAGPTTGGKQTDAAVSTYLDGDVRHAPMESVVDSSWICYGVAVDDTYLYMITAGLGELQSMRRCVKDNCAATLSRIAGAECPNCQVQSFERAGQTLGIAYLGSSSGARFDTCTLPDCTDVQRVIDNLPEYPEFVFDERRVYFTDGADPVLYACALPNCASGPKPLASGTSVRNFAADGGDVYWIDQRGRLNRTRGDGSTAVEVFDLGPALVHVGADAGVEPPVHGDAIALDANWLYANIADACGLFGPCPISGPLVRWPREPSGARQVLAEGLDTANVALQVFDGEVVFTKESEVWSCRADDCAATQRVLDGAYSRVMASDADYLYWCANTPDAPGGLRRVARIGH